MSRRPQQRGFTLLEVLVAVAVFAVVAALAYGGIDRVVNAKAGIDQHAARWRAVQLSLSVLHRELSAAIPIVDRGPYGEPRGLVGSATSIAWSHAARERWPGSNEPDLGRSALRWQTDELRLNSSPRLNPTPGTPATDALLLDRVDSVNIRYLSDGGEFAQWPPANAGVDAWPNAIRLTLTLDDLGVLTQTVILVEQP